LDNEAKSASEKSTKVEADIRKHLYQSHAAEQHREGDSVVELESDVVCCGLVLLEEVVLEAAHNVHHLGDGLYFFL
jgi:hypothetical protein